MRITLPTLPTTEQAFSALTQNGTTVPEQVCAYLLCALHLYTLDPEAGIAAMNQLRGPRPMTPYDSQFLRDRLRGKAYLPQSYFHGASPANNYTPAKRRRRFPPPLEAAAKGRPVVFVGILQHFEWCAHPCGRGSLDVIDYGTEKDRRTLVHPACVFSDLWCQLLNSASFPQCT